MKKICLLCLIVFLLSSALVGCRHERNDPAIVLVSSSRTVALAGDSDGVTVTADVRRAFNGPVPLGFFPVGDPVSDGTPVTFSANNDGHLSASTAFTINGKAAVTLTHPPISGVNNQVVAVIAAVDNILGLTNVKFIKQPSSVEVFIAAGALGTGNAELSVLSFSLKNTEGAIFHSISAINSADSSTVTGNFDASAGSTAISLTNPNGFRNAIPSNVETAFYAEAKQSAVGKTASRLSPPAPPPLPIIKVTYDIAAGAGLPSFSIDELALFTATDINGNAVLHPLITDMNVEGVTYDTEQ